jgi:hemerythrin-like metal-binding protein
MVGSILDSLVEYTKYHFSAEEELMKAYKYKEKNQKKHKEQHKMFVEKIQSFQNQYMKMEMLHLEDSLLFFLMDWLYAHIMCTDKEFCDFVKKAENREPIQVINLEARCNKVYPEGIQNTRHNSCCLLM